MALLAPDDLGLVNDLTWSELRFRAMGTDVHLSVLGDPTLLIPARQRLEDLEDRWSRFRPDSVLNGLNRAGGRPVTVDEETFALVALAVQAWRETQGRFDPTVLDALCAEGYDRTFDDLDPNGGGDRCPASVPGCAGIRLDPLYDQVVLPPAVRLDLGGIGKGRAADLVAKELVLAGARSGVVNLGGDLRVAGPPLDHPLEVAIDDPLRPGEHAAVVALRSGALATSSRTRRAWRVGGAVRHHLIDPVTGRSAQSGLAAVTVLATDAAWAEVLAKAAFVSGPAGGTALLERAGTPALLVTDDGEHLTASGFERHRA